MEFIWLWWSLLLTTSMAVFCATYLVLRGVVRALSAHHQRRRAEQVVSQLPDALVMIAAGLESGQGLLANLQQLQQESDPPLQTDVAQLLAQLRLGEALETSLRQWHIKVPRPELEAVISALQLAQHHGGQQGRVLRQLAKSMQTKQILRRRVAALSAQGRMQAKVMTGLPFLLLVALYFIERPTIVALSQHPLGWWSATALVLMLSCGYWFIRRQTTLTVYL